MRHFRHWKFERCTMKTKAWNLALGTICIALVVIPTLVEILVSERETRWVITLDVICSLVVGAYVIGRVSRRIGPKNLGILLAFAFAFVTGQALLRHETIRLWFGGLWGCLLGIAILEFFGVIGYFENLQRRLAASAPFR
jgi:hypothetical protein